MQKRLTLWAALYLLLPCVQSNCLLAPGPVRRLPMAMDDELVIDLPKRLWLAFASDGTASIGGVPLEMRRYGWHWIFPRWRCSELDRYFSMTDIQHLQSNNTAAGN